MKTIFLFHLILLFIFKSVNAQIITGVVEQVDIADTIIFNNQKYEVYINKWDEYHIWFQRERDSEEARVLRSTVQIVSDNRYLRDYVEVTPEMLRGKKMFISVVPYQVTMTQKWSAIVDSGIDSKTSKLEIDGERLNFKSELAIVNYLYRLSLPYL